MQQCAKTCVKCERHLLNHAVLSVFSRKKTKISDKMKIIHELFVILNIFIYLCTQ